PSAGRDVAHASRGSTRRSPRPSLRSVRRPSAGHLRSNAPPYQRGASPRRIGATFAREAHSERSLLCPTAHVGLKLRVSSATCWSARKNRKRSPPLIGGGTLEGIAVWA